MKIIALSAFKGSGKDTAADYLCACHNFVRVAFADPLKDQIVEKFEINRISLDKQSLKEKPILTLPVNPVDGFSRIIAEFMFKEFRSESGIQPDDFAYEGNRFVGVTGRDLHLLYWTPRSLAILVGSTSRSVDSSYWVKQAINKIKKEERSGFTNIVISDLRYKSEIEQLKNYFGNDVITVRINRFNNSSSLDPSEMDLVNYTHNFEIDNRGTKDELFSQLKEIAIQLSAN